MREGAHFLFGNRLLVEPKASPAIVEVRIDKEGTTYL